MRIVHLSVKNFRGIRSLEWSPPPGVTCLVGRGDSGKTTILDAIEFALLPRNRVQFVNSDFFRRNTDTSIEIEVTVVDVPHRLLTDEKFGLEQRGWSQAGELRDEPEDEDAAALTVRLVVDDAFEPEWRVVNDRNSEGRGIGPRDRAAIGAVRLGDATGRQLSWVSGSSLARVSDSPDEISAALGEAHRGAWEAIDELTFDALSETASDAGRWGEAYGSYAEVPLGVGLDPRTLNVGAGSLTLRQDNGISVSSLGTGSRRLLGLAIQRQAAGESVVSLVDEVEAGLEPHRLRHVLRQLRGSGHQVFLVSHSPVAVAELGAEGLAIARRTTDGNLTVNNPDESLQGVIRAMPEAILGTRVVVYPLQGIFDFAGRPVDWREHVAPQFERLPDLLTPHRWAETNPALGEWLTAIRPLLASGEPIDLTSGPSQRLATSPANQIAACYQASAEKGQSVVAIGKWPSDCHDLASKLGGTFGSMEELDCRGLMKFAHALDDASSGHAKAVLLLDFAGSCFTEVGSRLATFREEYASGRTPDTGRLTANRAAVESLNRVAAESTAGSLLAAARIFDRTPGARLYRRELWREMKTTLGTQVGRPDQSVAVTAWQVRDRARRVGRRPEQRIVSRTLLVKGLEFDHAVVTDIDSLTAKEAYVAMTRGRAGLTVLSGARTLKKAAVKNFLD